MTQNLLHKTHASGTSVNFPCNLYVIYILLLTAADQVGCTVERVSSAATLLLGLRL